MKFLLHLPTCPAPLPRLTTINLILAGITMKDLAIVLIMLLRFDALQRLLPIIIIELIIRWLLAIIWLLLRLLLQLLLCILVRLLILITLALTTWPCLTLRCCSCHRS